MRPQPRTKKRKRPPDLGRVALKLNPRQVEVLERLVATGFYGFTLEDALGRLVDDGLRRWLETSRAAGVLGERARGE